MFRTGRDKDGEVDKGTTKTHGVYTYVHIKCNRGKSQVDKAEEKCTVVYGAAWDVETRCEREKGILFLCGTTKTVGSEGSREEGRGYSPWFFTRARGLESTTARNRNSRQ